MKTTLDAETQENPKDVFRPRELAQWIKDVEQDQDLLRGLVEHIRNQVGPSPLHQNASLNLAASGSNGKLPRDYPPSRFKNWIRHRLKYLDINEVRNVLQYLVTNFRMLEFGGGGAYADRDKLADLVVVVAHLNDYLCVSPRNLDGLQRRFEGYYWVFRPSMTAPGRFLRGLLCMRWTDGAGRPEDSLTRGMLRVCEVHQHPGDAGHAMPVLFESYDGFALIKKGVLFLFMAEQFDAQDRGPLLITRIHNFLPADQTQPLQMAWGRSIGASNHAHALPIVISKVMDDDFGARSGTTPQPADLESLWEYTRSKNKATEPPQAYVLGLLDKCGIVDPPGLPPTVLAQIDAMNREACWFSEQFMHPHAR